MWDQVNLKRTWQKILWVTNSDSYKQFFHRPQCPIFSINFLSLTNMGSEANKKTLPEEQRTQGIVSIAWVISPTKTNANSVRQTNDNHNICIDLEAIGCDVGVQEAWSIEKPKGSLARLLETCGDWYGKPSFKYDQTPSFPLMKTQKYILFQKRKQGPLLLFSPRLSTVGLLQVTTLNRFISMCADQWV